MSTKLLSEHISPEANAKVLVMFGGSPLQRDRVIRQLQTLEGLSIWGTLSEEEGMLKIRELSRVDLVLIGGRYSQEQRKSIKLFLQQTVPHARVTEPGVDYPYSHTEVYDHIKTFLYHDYSNRLF